MRWSLSVRHKVYNIISKCDIIGICTSEGCSSCRILYDGEGCCNKWNSYAGWTELYWTYVAITIVVYVAFNIWIGYEIYIFIRSREGKSKWNLVSQGLLVVFLYAFSKINRKSCFDISVRLLYYAIDPDGYRGIFNREAEGIMFWLPVWLITIVSYLIILYWYSHNHFSYLTRLGLNCKAIL